MNRDLAKKIADAVLYEGYMLYPYRRSAIKNRQRWSFGILYPPDYCEVKSATEHSLMHSECLLLSKKNTRLNIQLRFLHLRATQVEQSVADGFEPVSSLVVDGHPIESWDEGIEGGVETELTLAALSPQTCDFCIPGNLKVELLRDGTGKVVGQIQHVQHELAGSMIIHAERMGTGVLKLSIDVCNTTSLPSDACDRNAALLRSFLSAHTILTATGGDFVSLLDPPDELQDLAAGCQNVRNFPVLLGENGERHMLLCSPILLYDYPQVAPESAGDFFDATEMDEMLTLRLMTLANHEKDELRTAGNHARQLLERTEQSAHEQLMRTHGTIRSLRPVGPKD
jgi:hypothetical protein